MSPPEAPPSRIELLDLRPDAAVPDAEYRRLLGFPPRHVPGARAQELAAWARQWYAEHGRPWIYLREAALEVADDAVRLDGTAFASRPLRDHLREAEARRALLAVVSAGHGCEAHARRLWGEEKPDEYFFLEVFGSAVVEHLVAAANGRICDLAERDGLIAVPHYSPGYAGWDVAEQNRLFDLITRGATQPFPEPMEVLASGMLRPKKSLLAVVGLTSRTPRALESARLVPCARCSFAPCRYRRAPYRPAPVRIDGVPAPRPLAPGAAYTVNPRALGKWAGERLQVDRRDDGTFAVCFRFDGTTCSNLGQPLAFDYRVVLSGPEHGYTILEADCGPAPGDRGHAQMCAWLNDAAALRHAWETEKPLLGRPLDEVLSWSRLPAPAGCHCTRESRLHKWGLALETIHYALAHVQDLSPPLLTGTS